MFAADSSQNTVFHNAARNGRLWVLAFFLSVELNKYEAHKFSSQGSSTSLVVRAQGSFLSGSAGRGGGAGDGGSEAQGSGDASGGAVAASAGAKKSKPASNAEGQMVVRDDGGNSSMPRDPTVATLLHCKDCDGHTPLDWACYSGHADVARLLVEHGLNPFSTDAGGKNCLHWAASQVKDTYNGRSVGTTPNHGFCRNNVVGVAATCVLVHGNVLIEAIYF